VFGLSYALSTRTRFALRSAIATQASYSLHACAVTISANLVSFPALFCLCFQSRASRLDLLRECRRRNLHLTLMQVLNQVNAIPYATRSIINISTPALSSTEPLSASSVNFASVADALLSHNYSTTLSNRSLK
jgi:hypothetical protein